MMPMAAPPPSRLIERLPPVRGRVSENASLAGITWFRVGGPAEVMFRPADQEDLLAFLQHDRILADQVDSADVAVEIHPHARPVEARGDLLDVRRLAGAVVALDQHPPVVREARENGERGVAIETVGLVDVGHVLLGIRESRHNHVAFDAEYLAHRHFDVGHAIG